MGTTAELADPYELRPEDVRDPPRTLREALLRIGPGMILAASIVGSGELIATTTLGAEAGYPGLTTAVAVFGITGVGATELFMYPYWCVEKGYARFTGRREQTPAWRERARGWIRLMHVDIGVSLVVYTVATVAFYLLGAGILHGTGQVPAAKDMIPVLSSIYTRTLGGWALGLFYLGAGGRALRDDLRQYRRPLPPLRRHVPAHGLLREGRLPAAPGLPPAVRGDALGGPRGPVPLS
jgi:Mn2+/Fe2+ NRAMP family transporter